MQMQIVDPLLSPPPPRREGGYFYFKHIWGGGAYLI